MLTKKAPKALKANLLSSFKVSVFMFLLTIGFTSCQDEGIAPNSKLKDSNISSPIENSASSEKPPHEPDYGG